MPLTLALIGKRAIFGLLLACLALASSGLAVCADSGTLELPAAGFRDIPFSYSTPWQVQFNGFATTLIPCNDSGCNSEHKENNVTVTGQTNIFLPIVLRTTMPPCSQATITGRIFHDLNGNGIYDTAFSIGDLGEHPDGYLGAVGPFWEPPVAGAVITIDDHEITSDSNGWYRYCLPVGINQLSIQANPYRFYFPSSKEIRDLSQAITVQISQYTRLDLGLGMGPLTFPFRLSEKDLFRQGSFTDIDPFPNSIGVYNSYPEDCNWWHCSGDAHRGIDYYAPEGTVVVSAAPGMVYSVGTADDGSAMVIIIHTDFDGLEPWLGSDIRWADRGFQTSYQHLSHAIEGIQPGVMVSRGQRVGYLDEAIHLHIDAQLILEPGNWASGGYIDLYRDTFHDQLVFLEHDSHYGYMIKISQGSPGFWTADLLPHFGDD
ncbi:MAG: peptidoglycan DD-metalloendopeptidase family protein [Anaerolineales bacterium]|nr:peptidoglycan DD-metalloendopeptidase family protein [Anaerolineales bacterium]